MNITHEELTIASCIPVSIRERNGHRLVEWLFTGQEPYIEPFFDETITRCRIHPNNSGKYISSSTLDFLSDITIPEDSLVPTAFIFHVSRCGSTLLSQLLSLDERHVVLSEVPIFEYLLREPNLDERERGHLLRKLISLYAQRRAGHEQQLFIKLDAWHLYDYRLIRECFPETACIFLYREPAAVMHSHRLRRGAHMVPGQFTHPFDIDTSKTIDFETYSANVLRCYYETGLRLCQSGTNVFALDYNEGILEGLLRICEHIGLEFAPELIQRMVERAKTHSKYPGETFQPVTVQFHPTHAAYFEAKQAYEDLATVHLA